MSCYRGHDAPRSKRGACKQCALEYNRQRRAPIGGQMLSYEATLDVINAVRSVLGLDELEPS